MAVPSVTNSSDNTSGGSATSVDITLTVSSGSGRVLICWPMFIDIPGTTTDISSVTFDPAGGDEASFTNEAGATGIQDYGTGRLSTECWYLVLSNGVTTGSYTVRITANESCNIISGVAWEVAGADTTDPIGASAGSTGFSDTISGAVTTTATNSLVAMGGVHRVDTNFTAGADDTEQTDNNATNQSRWSGYTPAATTGGYTVSAADTSNGHWSTSTVEIFEGATGPDAVSVSISPDANYIQIS